MPEVKVSLRQCVRVVYASLATIYSIFGLLEFGLALPLYNSATTGNSQLNYIKFYLALRFILAVVQIPAHASVLFSMRFFLVPAEQFTRDVLGNGNLDQGISLYYKLINICNVAMAGFLILGIAAVSVASSVGMGSSGSTLEALEIMSILCLSTVLGARIVGALTNSTRQWFYLSWGSHASGVPSSPPPTSVPHPVVHNHMSLQRPADAVPIHVHAVLSESETHSTVIESYGPPIAFETQHHDSADDPSTVLELAPHPPHLVEK